MSEEIRNILLKQIRILEKINEDLEITDPEQVRKNIETMVNVIQVFEIENSYSI